VSPNDDLGRKTASAALWAFLSAGGSRLVALATLVILARLLAPLEFGLFAFALVWVTYVETLGDLGTGVALIYWPDRRSEAAQVTFLINMLTGWAWFALTWTLAPAIADFFNSPEGTAIVRGLAFSFPLKFLGNTHDALAQKDLRFRARALPEMALTTIKGIIAVSLAFAGFGAWSLVWGQLGGVAVSTALLWMLVPWRPSLSMPRQLVGPMLVYGRGIVAVNILAAIVHHADAAVVGRMIGAQALGLYHVAARVPEMSIAIIFWVVGKVVFPAFARLHSAGESLRDAYLAALRYVSLFTIPAAIGLFATAYPLVETFFGEKWIGAAPILQLLALYGGIRSLGTHAGDVMKATGRTNLLAGLGVLKAAVIVPALIFAARYGVVAVAGALAVATLATVALNLVVMMRLIDLRFAPLWDAVRTSLAAGLVLAVTLAIVSRFTGAMAAPAALAVLVTGGVGAYAAATWTIDRTAILTAARLLRRPAVTIPRERESQP
jgi:O-antigen/teichoic acid export membrane protein